MNGVLGHGSARVRLYWVRDNLDYEQEGMMLLRGGRQENWGGEKLREGEDGKERGRGEEKEGGGIEGGESERERNREGGREREKDRGW